MERLTSEPGRRIVRRDDEGGVLAQGRGGLGEGGSFALEVVFRRLDGGLDELAALDRLLRIKASSKWRTIS